MVNKYKRKTERASWSEATMQLAMEEAKTTSVSSAAKKYGLTLSTLQRHIKKGSCEKKLGRYQPVFNDKQETELLEYVFQVDDVFYGMTKNEFLELVYEYAEKNNVSHPFKHGRAGNDWYLGFKKRHPELAIRQPEPTSIARARGFNKPQVDRFFDILAKEIDTHAIDATRIYNVDETGIQTTSNKPPKIMSRTGKKQVGVISSCERGKLTTVVCCCNAAGSFIPPFLIFGRKRMVGRLLDGAPPGTNATCTDNGWINGPKFLEWLRHFVEVTRPTPERKVILVMDNHESHKYLGALEYASQNNVIFVSLPPHTTHRMQPLDRCVYGPLKTYFEQAVSVFQRSHVGRIISQYEVARLFGDAYMRAASAQNAISGFKSTGIWPTNRHIFDESDFLPSMMTDRPDPSTPAATENLATCDEPTATQSMPRSGEIASDNRLSVDSDRTVSPSMLETETFNLTDLSVTTIDMNKSPVSVNIQTINVDDPIPKEVSSYNENVEQDINLIDNQVQFDENIIEDRCFTPVKSITLRPVSSPSASSVKPIDIRPMPKLSPNKTNRKRKIQRAEVLTSTPFKLQQKEKEERKTNKKVGVENKTAKKGKKKASNLPSSSKMKKVHKKPERKYFCLVCGDSYIHPPKEDWIECGDCKEWAHEACTSYSGVGSYFCDLCQE